MEALTSRCILFLDNEISTVETLRNIKTECLREYEKGAIGPSKEAVRKALEKEIDTEVQRTYALLAKTKYQEILRVQTETFKYEDQVKASVEVILDELTKLLEKKSQDILLGYPELDEKLSNDLSKELHKEREFYLKALKQKITLTSEVANFRSSIEALIEDGPCEEEHLKKQIGKKRKDAWESIEKTFKEVEQANFALTEGMLKEALEDITRNIETQNYNLSTTKCNSSLLQLLEELRGDCQNFLASDTSEIVILRDSKAKFLRKYDEIAIGPAKADKRDKLGKEIVEEVQRTFALFAKANYLKILGVKTETFQYKDQVHTSVEVNLNELTEHLEKQSKDILLEYPELEDKFTTDLSKELHREREFYLKALKQKITLNSEVENFRSSIEDLIKDGPCEEEHLKKQIDKKRKKTWESIENTFKEVEQTNFALTKAMLEKEIEDKTRNIESKNHNLSTTSCNGLSLQLSEDIKLYCKRFLACETSVIDTLRQLKDDYLRKYDHAAIGPAKAKERETLVTEIVDEIDRTCVLFAHKKITQLRPPGILEKDDLEKKIDTAKKELKKILKKDGVLTEERETLIKNVDTSFNEENFEQSRINCQETFDSLFKYNWNYLTKKYFKKLYDEKCKGPAKQKVWEKNEAKVDKYYNSYSVMFRKMSSPIRLYYHRV